MAMRVVKSRDLSHPLESGMPVYPGDPEVGTRSATTIARDGYNVLHLSMGSQSGTHIDAPFHFLEHGQTIDAFPPEVFFGEATIADVSGLGPNGVIEPDSIPAPDSLGGILLIRTDWSERWGSHEYFSHPFLSAAAAQRIVDMGFTTVAIDALSVDQTDGSAGDFGAHEVILGANIPIAENLRGLSGIDWVKPWVSLLPLKISHGDGAPIRAVAYQLEHS